MNERKKAAMSSTNDVRTILSKAHVTMSLLIHTFNTMYVSLRKYGVKHTRNKTKTTTKTKQPNCITTTITLNRMYKYNREKTNLKRENENYREIATAIKKIQYFGWMYTFATWKKYLNPSLFFGWLFVIFHYDDGWSHSDEIETYYLEIRCRTQDERESGR